MLLKAYRFELKRVDYSVLGGNTYLTWNSTVGSIEASSLY